MTTRVKELRRLGILDTEEEEIFNEIVSTASSICESPISLIALLDEDRQWFKAKVGTEVKETPIAIAVCNHTINSKDGNLYVKDLSVDERFKSNPFVTDFPNLRSYFGVALTTENNVRIGTVCVFDDKIREFDEKQIACLNTLANYTMHMIEEKRLRREFEIQNQSLLKLNKKLDEYNYLIAHDVKAPLRTIRGFTQLITKDQKNILSTESKEYFSFINNAAEDLEKMTNSLLEYSRKTIVCVSDFEEIDIKHEIEEVIRLLDPQKKQLSYILNKSFPKISTSKSVIQHSILNVISNAIKYKDKNKKEQKLDIRFEELDNQIALYFIDNGIGMPPERLSQVFHLFNRDKRKINSFGIGLTITKEILNRIGSEISLDSALGKGTTVKLDIQHQVETNNV